MKTLLRSGHLKFVFFPMFLLLSSGSMDASPAQLLAAYTFDGNAADTTGNSPPMQLRNAPLTSGYLFLNGKYEGADPNGFHATAPITGFSYNSFTIALDFYAWDFLCDFQPSCHDNIITGGSAYRWFSLRHNAGRLQVLVNNSSLGYVLASSQLSSNRWHSVLCSLDVPTRKIITYLDNVRMTDIDLPAGFQFEVIGTSFENSDKEFTFVKYSNGSVFYGYADNLKVWNRALSASEIDAMINNPSLTIQRAVIVTWPDYPPNLILRCATNITGPYQPYTGPLYHEASQYKVAVPLGGSQKFFQLFGP